MNAPKAYSDQNLHHCKKNQQLCYSEEIADISGYYPDFERNTKKCLKLFSTPHNLIVSMPK